MLIIGDDEPNILHDKESIAADPTDSAVTLLAPDIVEAILADRADQGITLERPLPASWAEQRAAVLSPQQRISSPGSSWSRTR
jgi:hypothetical protein